MATLDYTNSIDFSKKSIGTIYITGGGFIREPFSGAGTDSMFGWEEMTWFKDPTRSRTFAFSNMDDIDVGLIARCEINIKYMNIQQYMKLRQILGRQRHFTVEFFDTDKGDWVIRDMYCSENTRSRFFTLKKSLIGVMDYSIKLVGTNLDMSQDSELTITYDLNGGSGDILTTDGQKPQEKIEWGGQIHLASSKYLSAPSGKHFDCWVTKNGETITGQYGANQSLTVWDNLHFFAQYK